MAWKRRKMFDIIFKAREEKLATLTYEDKISFKEHNIDRSAGSDSLEAELEKMPKDFRQLKESIKIKLEGYIETVNRENRQLNGSLGDSLISAKLFYNNFVKIVILFFHIKIRNCIS